MGLLEQSASWKQLFILPPMAWASSILQAVTKFLFLEMIDCTKNDSRSHWAGSWGPNMGKFGKEAHFWVPVSMYANCNKHCSVFSVSLNHEKQGIILFGSQEI